MARFGQPFRGIPRLEGVLDVVQARRRELRIVSKENGLERGIVDPVQARLRVRLGVEGIGEEMVRLQPSTRIQNENLKERLAETEAPRTCPLGARADVHVELLDVAVDAPERRDVLGVVGQVFEVPDRP